MFEKLKKRRAFPVDGREGEFVRLLTKDEKKAFTAMRGDAKAWYLFGKVIVEQDGSQVCPQTEGESDEAFATRVCEAMGDVDDGVLLQIRQSFDKLMRGESVPLDNLAKN